MQEEGGKCKNQRQHVIQLYDSQTYVCYQRFYALVNLLVDTHTLCQASAAIEWVGATG
jgi:hypothetical protein